MRFGMVNCRRIWRRRRTHHIRVKANGAAMSAVDGLAARRVVVADDDVLLREGLGSLLGRPCFDVVGQAGDGPALLALVRHTAWRRRETCPPSACGCRQRCTSGAPGSAPSGICCMHWLATGQNIGIALGGGATPIACAPTAIVAAAVTVTVKVPNSVCSRCRLGVRLAELTVVMVASSWTCSSQYISGWSTCAWLSPWLATEASCGEPPIPYPG